MGKKGEGTAVNGVERGKKGPCEGADAKLTFDRLMLLSTHSAAKLRILDSGAGLSAQTRRISAEIFLVHLPPLPRQPFPQPSLPL